MKISSIKDLETLLKVVYKYIPKAPRPIHKALVTATPYLSLAIGTFFISIALLPYIYPSYPLDPLRETSIIALNIHLTRLVFVIIGLILITSFNRLLRKSLEGWYNLFYTSFFYAIVVMVIFNPLSVGMLFVAWAYLFEVQSDFS